MRYEVILTSIYKAENLYYELTVRYFSDSIPDMCSIQDLITENETKFQPTHFDLRVLA
jgi:hypothetical protein